MITDELIRQVTLESPERGLLLLRTRDEIRMTLDAYKTLHGSSVTFGVRKALQGEEGMAEMEGEIQNLREGNSSLENEMIALRAKLEVAERANAEVRSLDEKKRREEVAFLKHQQQHLEQFLSALPKS
jgi:dynein light intermediate chain